MNLLVLKKSTVSPKAGDIFAYSPLKGIYYFGRVIREDAQWVTGGKCLLCYAYDAKSTSLREIPSLTNAKLLIDPFMINTLPWKKGYFVTVAHVSLSARERQQRHYFTGVDGNYYDEYYHPVAKPRTWYEAGLSSYKYFDAEISEKLHLTQSFPR